MKALITSSCQGPAGNHLEAGEVHDLTNEQIGDLRGRVSLDKDAIKAAEDAAGAKVKEKAK